MIYNPNPFFRRPRSIRLQHASNEPCGYDGCDKPASWTTDPWDVESCGEHRRSALRDASFIEGDSCQDAVDMADTIRTAQQTGY